MTSVLVAALALTAGQACKRPAAPGSALQSGLITSYVPYNLLGLPPNASLTLCNPGRYPVETVQLVQRAVTEWLAAIGRDRYVRIQTAPCPAAGAQIRMEQPNVTTNDRTNICSPQTSHTAFTQPEEPPQLQHWVVVFCNATTAADYQVVVHEVGHMFAQCDRYGVQGHPDFGQNCAEIVGPLQPSAMQGSGGTHPGHVTNDDRNGLLRVAGKQPMQTATAAWGAFLTRLGVVPGSPSPGAAGAAPFGGAPETSSLPSAGAVAGAPPAGASAAAGCAAGWTFYPSTGFCYAPGQSPANYGCRPPLVLHRADGLCYDR